MKILDLAPVTISGFTYREVCAEVARFVQGGGVAVQLFSRDEGYWEPVASLTVNVPDDPRLGLKVWSREYQGLAESLEAQGLVRRTGKTRPSGYITLAEIELTGALAALVEEEEEEKSDDGR